MSAVIHAHLCRCYRRELEHTFARLAVDGTLHVPEYSTGRHYNVQENIWDI